MPKRDWVFLMLAIVLSLTACLISGCGPKIYNDGSYMGISQADEHGYAIAEITVKNDKINAVKLVEITEKGVERDYGTYPYPKAKEANEEMAKRFVGRQNANVDTVAGATSSSKKYIEAVSFALEKAKKKPTIETTYFSGTFMGRSGADEYGYGVAWVTIKNDRITEVRLEEVTADNEFKDYVTYPWTAVVEAKAELEKQFVEKNSAQVDTYAGATRSSTKWIEAVSNALNNAKAK